MGKANRSTEQKPEHREARERIRKANSLEELRAIIGGIHWSQRFVSLFGHSLLAADPERMLPEIELLQEIVNRVGELHQTRENILRLRSARTWLAKSGRQKILTGKLLIGAERWGNNRNSSRF